MRILLVFLKEPIPGKVKTRLAAEIGDDKACEYYKAMVEVMLRQLQGLENCRIRFCFAPDDADDAIRFWILPAMNATASGIDGLYLADISQEIDFAVQGSGDLGDRLTRSVKQAYDDGFSEIAIIGSDCPDCGARWINAALSRLSGPNPHDTIIGPSNDGGYYLLAIKSPIPELFQNISWSSDQVFKQTLAVATSMGLQVECLPQLTDVDTHEDWQQLIDSPLGPALKKSLGLSLDDPDFSCL